MWVLLHWHDVAARTMTNATRGWAHRMRFVLFYSGFSGKRVGTICKVHRDKDHWRWGDGDNGRELLFTYSHLYFNWVRGRPGQPESDRHNYADVSIAVKRTKFVSDPVEGFKLPVVSLPADRRALQDEQGQHTLVVDPFCATLAYAIISGGFGTCVYVERDGNWHVEQQEWGKSVHMDCFKRQIASIFKVMPQQVPVAMHEGPILPALNVSWSP